MTIHWMHLDCEWHRWSAKHVRLCWTSQVQNLRRYGASGTQVHSHRVVFTLRTLRRSSEGRTSPSNLRWNAGLQACVAPRILQQLRWLCFQLFCAQTIVEWYVVADLNYMSQPDKPRRVASRTGYFFLSVFGHVFCHGLRRNQQCLWKHCDPLETKR